MAAFVGPVLNLIDRVIPDRAANDAAKATLGQMALKGELDQVTGQIQTNITEAQSKSVWVAGWRPYVGWICGTGLLYAFLLRPILNFICALFGKAALAPEIDITELHALLVIMLGMGILRTVDKTQGTASGH